MNTIVAKLEKIKCQFVRNRAALRYGDFSDLNSACLKVLVHVTLTCSNFFILQIFRSFDRIKADKSGMFLRIILR